MPTGIMGGAGMAGGSVPAGTGGTADDVGTAGAAGAMGAAGAGGGAATGGTGATPDPTPTLTGPVLVSTIDLRGASGCPGMRLGDINGDGRMEIVVGQPVDQATLDSYTPQRVAAVSAFDLKGNLLWQFGTPNTFHTASSDIPLQVYDMDGDGKSEVFAEGWLDGNGVYKGRPVDVAPMKDGSLLISDDYVGAIYRVTYSPN